MVTARESIFHLTNSAIWNLKYEMKWSTTNWTLKAMRTLLYRTKCFILYSITYIAFDIKDVIIWYGIDVAWYYLANWHIYSIRATPLTITASNATGHPTASLFTYTFNIEFINDPPYRSSLWRMQPLCTSIAQGPFIFFQDWLKSQPMSADVTNLRFSLICWELTGRKRLTFCYIGQYLTKP